MTDRGGPLGFGILSGEPLLGGRRGPMFQTGESCRGLFKSLVEQFSDFLDNASQANASRVVNTLNDVQAGGCITKEEESRLIDALFGIRDAFRTGDAQATLAATQKFMDISFAAKLRGVFRPRRGFD